MTLYGLIAIIVFGVAVAGAALAVFERDYRDARRFLLLALSAPLWPLLAVYGLIWLVRTAWGGAR